MIDIFFIRHGATEGNLRRRYIGRTDEPLCEAGIAQVKALQKRGLSVDRLFVSPMLRTRQTAELLFPQMPYTVVDGLAETDFGRFEGKSADELLGDPAYQAWVDAMCLTPIPEGESVCRDNPNRAGRLTRGIRRPRRRHHGDHGGICASEEGLLCLPHRKRRMPARRV